MRGTEGIVALVIGIPVMFFVPALVWARVIAGLSQSVSESTREPLPPEKTIITKLWQAGEKP